MASGQYLPMGCYGKLPCWPEYLEHNVSFPGSRALREWIRDGRKEARIDPGSGEAREFQETDHRRFAFGLPGSTELVIGVIRPSADQTGRSHPFAVFVHVPRRQYGKRYKFLPLAMAPVWEALDDAWNGLAAHNTRAAFDDQLASTLVPVPAPVAEVKGIYQGMLQEDVGRIFAPEGPSSLRALQANLPSVLPDIRKSGNSRQVRIEMPVSREPGEACFEASFWIDLMDKQFFWKRLEPAVFMAEGAGDGGEAHVLLLFGPLEATAYAAVMAPRAVEGGILRPAAGENDPEGEGDAEQGVKFSDLLARRFDARGQTS